MNESSTTISITEVQSRAQRALESSPVYGLRNLQVGCEHDALVITGQVSSFYHKQLAQEIVLAIAAGTRIVNHVRVEPSDEESGYPVRQRPVLN